MTLFILMCGIALGGILRPVIRKAWRKWRKDEEATRTAEEKAQYAKGRAEGKADAISVLVDTDENAAIIEALGQWVLEPHGSIRARDEESCTYSLAYWVWQDKSLKRAGLEAKGPTPRDAYKSYLAQREAAKAICEQLDELDRVRKEQAEATRA
mgnify:CR=1 FL=1